jgi:acetylornithine deacetylase
VERRLTHSLSAVLADLINIPSVSSTSNIPVIDYVEGFLDRHHWQLERFPYQDANGVAKTNAVVRAAGSTSATPVEVALVCHTDTVPYDTTWAEAIHAKEQDGRMYGRGSCDVKGFLACALTTLAGIQPQQLSKPVALILTADEEVGCIGAKHLAAANVISPRRIIIGEPTGLQPVRAGKGYALGKIVVEGRESHSAYPSRGRSAIYDAARVVLALERVSQNLQERIDEAFDPPFTTLNVGLIQGGTAKNIVAGECSMTVEWRSLPNQNPAWTPRLIEEALDALRAEDSSLQVRFEILRDDPAFAPSPSKDLATSLTKLTGRESTTIAFGSEAPHLGRGAQEVVVFGPGDMTVAHRTGEFVPTSELDACARCLSAIVHQYCA